MKYLLDTNIISETIKVQPDKNVEKWLKEIPSDSLYISVLTIGEIRRGIEKLEENSNRKNKLVLWLEQDLLNWFGDNILSINQEIAERWGYITSSMKSHQLTAIDSLLAASAMTHNLKMVTRNIKDFDVPGLEILNPFED